MARTQDTPNSELIAKLEKLAQEATTGHIEATKAQDLVVKHALATGATLVEAQKVWRVLRKRQKTMTPEEIQEELGGPVPELWPDWLAANCPAISYRTA